jgi:hypothetical protein
MPNDAKLGLVVGVGLVVVIAVVFCRREPASPRPAGAPAAAAVAPTASHVPLSPAGKLRLVPANPTAASGGDQKPPFGREPGASATERGASVP